VHNNFFYGGDKIESEVRVVESNKAEIVARIKIERENALFRKENDELRKRLSSLGNGTALRKLREKNAGLGAENNRLRKALRGEDKAQRSLKKEIKVLYSTVDTLRRQLAVLTKNGEA